MDKGASLRDRAGPASPGAPAGLRHSGTIASARGAKRVLVCGGRQYANYRFVWEVLRKLNEHHDVEAIIHGAARGADEWARMWVHKLANTGDGPHPRAVAYPANWKKHGKAAGAIRNQQMLDEGEPDLVVAFPGGRGTDDMVRRANKAAVQVLDLREPPAQGTLLREDPKGLRPKASGPVHEVDAPND
jgi:hypothetical protein